VRAALALFAATAAACGSSRPLNADFFGPTIEPPCGLARIQPGISVARPKVTPPSVASSTLPLSNVRCSSGFDRFLLCIFAITFPFVLFLNHRT